jgi:hypothetical protein
MSNEAQLTKSDRDERGELDHAGAVLTEVCAELERLTDVAPPELHAADVDVNAPPLFVYGILGGKDVGKTTLINALAESRISHEYAGIGEGTHTPVVYVHHDDAPLLRDRLGRDPGLEFELVTHDRQLLRHVALVDLPDFDSKRNLPDHARRAAAFKPHLDAFIWVTTVRKIDHPELLRQMNSVAPKKDNFYCVVTFADEVIRSGKDSLDGLRAMCLEKLRQLYFADFAADNLFAICTLDKASYDFPSLTNELVRQHSPQEIADRRRRNALRSAAANVELVRRHYQLNESLAALDALIGELPDRCGENMPAAYWDVVTERVGRLDGPYRRMAARLFAHRIWGWPILSALLFPLSAVVSFLGGRLFFETGSRWTDYHQLKDILNVDGLGLEVRMQRVASELKAKYLRLHQAFRELLGGELDVAAELDGWAGWLDEHDRKALDELQDRYGRPNFVKRWLVYLPLLWFPIVQPVLESFLDKPELTSGKLLQGLALTAVSLLSAGYLLRSAAVLFIIYTMWLLWFYSSSARQVARQRLTGFASLRQSVLEPSLEDRLRAAYDHLADTLRGLSDRLVREAERLEDELGQGR